MYTNEIEFGLDYFNLYLSMCVRACVSDVCECAQNMTNIWLRTYVHTHTGAREHIHLCMDGY